MGALGESALDAVEDAGCFVCLQPGGATLRPCACRGQSGTVHERCLQRLFLSYLETPDGVRRAQAGQCPTCRQRYSPAALASIFRAIVGALPPRNGLAMVFRLQLGEVLVRDSLAEDAEAQPLLRAVLAQPGADGMVRARACKALAKAVLREGRVDEAEAMLSDCLSFFLTAEAQSGLDCRWACGTRLNLSSVLRARGEHALAAEQLQIVTSRYRRERGDGDRDTASAAAALGCCLAESGRAREAREAVDSVFEAAVSVLGPDSEEVAQLREALRLCTGSAS